MFFILSKLLTVLLRPLFWLLLLLVWAWLTRNQKRRRKLLIISVALLFLSSNKVLINELARAWEAEPARITGQWPETAVILGGYAEWDQHRNRVQMSDAAERFYVPLTLYQQGKVRRFLLSGGASSLTGRLKPEADYVLPVLRSFGVPDSAIWVENTSRNTHENALNTAALMRRKNVAHDTVLLVTSAFHMKRAAAVFRKAGVAVIPYPVHYISDYGRGYFFPDFFIPSSEALFRFDALSKEWIGYLVYAVTGKL